MLGKKMWFKTLCVTTAAVVLASGFTSYAEALSDGMTEKAYSVAKLGDEYTDKTQEDAKVDTNDDGVYDDEGFDKTDASDVENRPEAESDGNISENDADNKKGKESLKEGISNRVVLSFDMLPRMELIDSFATVELYDGNGKLVGEKTEWVGGITKNLTFEFDASEYKLGESFYLKLKDGLSYIKYYDKTYRVGERIKLDTYGYTDENGEYFRGDTFDFDACPLYEHMIVVYVDGEMQKLNPRARLIEDISMVPVRAVAEAMGLEVRYDDVYKSVVCEIAGKQALFNIGTNYATLMGKDTFMPYDCVLIEGTTFVPIRSLAEAFGCEVEAIDFEDHIDVCIGESPIVKEYTDKFYVNKMNISSKTRYMVWISKSDYRVRVYVGKQNKWNEIKSFPCAIGAADSPTITGSYEYEYKMSRWTYPEYYVGPCLVFYGNYAMHSTLIAYDGSLYDDRVGVKISHGCVRLHKSDIDWLDGNLPIGSRIYITE